MFSIVTDKKGCMIVPCSGYKLKLKQVKEKLQSVSVIHDCGYEIFNKADQRDSYCSQCDEYFSLDEARNKLLRDARNSRISSIQLDNLVCEFGKHKGTLYSEIPESYLKWMVASGHSKADLAQAEIKRRRFE